jgi:hypothetical protein
MARYLASEIAEKIQARGENPIKVLNRVRNWTKMGLLQPVKEAHPGSSLAHVYSEETLLDAALLNMFNAAGTPAVDAAEALKEAKQLLDEHSRDSMLHISRPHDQGTWQVGVTEPAQLGGWIKRQPKNTYVVVYVKHLFEGLGL